MKRVFCLVFGAALLLQPLAVDAQIFNGTPLPVEYLDFVGGSGQGGTFGGVQVGPYRGAFEASAVTGRTTTTPQFSLYCVDYLHYVSNSNGLVNVSSLSGDLSNTRLNDLGRYQTSAYLSSLFDGWQAHSDALEALYGGTFSRRDVWSGLHSAIWAIGTGPENLGVTHEDTNQARNYFFALADANAGSFDTSGWYVLSEADVRLGSDASGQEFLIRTASVPEPSTLLLMLGGVVLLFGAYRRREIELG